jgi:hypothetical protein
MLISVRRAVAGDARAIAEVQVAGWEAAYRGLVPDAFLDAFTVEVRTARWVELLEQGSVTYVTDGGFLLGDPARSRRIGAGRARRFVCRAVPLAPWGRTRAGRHSAIAR